MKKFMALVCVLALATVSAFAVETYGELDFSIPVLSEVESNGTDKVKTTSLAGGFSGRAMMSNIVGIYGAVDVVFPMKIVNSLGAEIKRDIFERWAGFDALVGLAIVPVNKGMFKLLIAPGFHVNFQYIKFSSQLSGTSTWLGAGANLMAEFHFSEKFYFAAGTGLFYDFHIFNKTRYSGELAAIIGKASDSQSGRAKAFTVQPRVGIGFRL